MRKMLFSFLGLLMFFPSFAQEVGNFNTEKFPEVSFTLKSNNPEVLTINQVRVFEEGVQDTVMAFEVTKAQTLPAIKNVLFLWDFRLEGSFVSELLFDFFNGMMATGQTSDSLKMNVAVFMRDEEGNPTCYPLLASFTADLEDLRNNVVEKQSEKDEEKNSKTKSKDKNKTKTKKSTASSDILWALEQAINQIKTLHPDEAKAIVLCTDGKNNADTGSETTPLINRAIENRIQIYVVNVAGGELGETFGGNIASRTYGLCLSSEGSFDTKKERAAENKRAIEKQKQKQKQVPYPFLFEENETITAWVNNLPQRWVGNTYLVKFKSRFPKIGQRKDIKVQLTDETFRTSYDIPKYVFADWIRDHRALFWILLLVVIAGIATGLFFFIRYLRDVAADKREEEEQLEAERKRLKQEQETLRRKLDVAENEQRRRQEQEKAREKAAKRQEEIDALNALMRSKNVRARVMVSTMTGAYEYQIATAENTIGSADDNTIVIEDQTVSRHHAVLYFNGENFGIRDLRSTNGLVMNGFRVDDLKLRNGDSVSLGNAVLKIYI